MSELTSEMAERAILEGLLQKRIEWMSALSRTRQKIKGTADLPEALENLSELIRRLLDARSLFLIRWSDQDEQSEFLCHLTQDEPALDAEGIRSSLPKKALPSVTTLSKESRLSSQPMRLASLPTPLQMCLAGDEPTFAAFDPDERRRSRERCFGIGNAKAAQNLMPAQTELISKIALDLAEPDSVCRLIWISHAPWSRPRSATAWRETCMIR